MPFVGRGIGRNLGELKGLLFSVVLVVEEGDLLTKLFLALLFLPFLSFSSTTPLSQLVTPQDGSIQHLSH